MINQKITSWSDGKKNAKFIQRGGEILKMIGGELLRIDFSKEEDKWTASNPIPVIVSEIGDFDPLTGTYKIIYKEKDKDNSEDLRITPEGFSFNVPENDGWMKRFVTYSNHFLMMEEELYYRRLKDLFNSGRGILGPDQLSQFSTGKHKKERLGTFNYISAVIDSDVPGGVNEGILAFRISEISKLNKYGKNWDFGIRDDTGDYISIRKFKEDPDTKQWMVKNFSIDDTVLGDLKFIDIETPKQ